MSVWHTRQWQPRRPRRLRRGPRKRRRVFTSFQIFTSDEKTDERFFQKYREFRCETHRQSRLSNAIFYLISFYFNFSFRLVGWSLEHQSNQHTVLAGWRCYHFLFHVWLWRICESGTIFLCVSQTQGKFTIFPLTIDTYVTAAVCVIAVFFFILLLLNIFQEKRIISEFKSKLAVTTSHLRPTTVFFLLFSTAAAAVVLFHFSSFCWIDLLMDCCWSTGFARKCGMDRNNSHHFWLADDYPLEKSKRREEQKKIKNRKTTNRIAVYLMEH